jgi:hypothetical protein
MKRSPEAELAILLELLSAQEALDEHRQRLSAQWLSSQRLSARLARLIAAGRRAEDGQNAAGPALRNEPSRNEPSRDDTSQRNTPQENASREDASQDDALAAIEQALIMANRGSL